jgi:antitoxin VapB
MTTAKVFPNGQSQAVRLPKEYRFSESEVGIVKLGEMVVLFPKDKNWEIFSKTQAVSDDFGDVILNARQNEIQSTPREAL